MSALVSSTGKDCLRNTTRINKCCLEPLMLFKRVKDSSDQKVRESRSTSLFPTATITSPWAWGPSVLHASKPQLPDPNP